MPYLDNRSRAAPCYRLPHYPLGMSTPLIIRHDCLIYYRTRRCCQNSDSGTLGRKHQQSSSPTAAVTEPDVTNSCQSQPKLEKAEKMIRARIWVRWSFAPSLPAQKCWNKELVLHFKVALTTARATIFRASSKHNRDGKHKLRAKTVSSGDVSSQGGNKKKQHARFGNVSCLHHQQRYFDTLTKSDEIFFVKKKKDAELISRPAQVSCYCPYRLVGHQIYTVLLSTNNMPNKANYQL